MPEGVHRKLGNLSPGNRVQWRLVTNMFKYVTKICKFSPDSPSAKIWALALSVSVSRAEKKFKNFKNFKKIQKFKNSKQIFLSFLGFTLQEKDILSCEKFKNVSNIRLVHSYILGLYIRRFLGVSGNITWCIFKSFINFGNFMIRSCAFKSVIGPIVDSFWDLNSPKIESRRY